MFNLWQEIVERHRRNVAVQPGQFSGPCLRQQILSCRQHLAEFYEGRSELLECEPRALLHFKMRGFGGFPPVQCMSCVLEQRSNASATHEVSQPCRTKTLLISRKRGSSRAVLHNPETIRCQFPFIGPVSSGSASGLPAI